MPRPLIALTITAALFSGCANIPENLRTSEGQSPISMEAAKTAATTPVGQIGRWGGQIVGVTNLADKTRIEILSKPLGDTTRPRDTDRNHGRFAAYFPGFLEPALYAQGREITVLGRIGAMESGQVGESDYRFTTLEAQSHKLWPKRVPVVYSEPDVFIVPGFGFYPWIHYGGHHGRHHW